jgi:hypothetical protein
MGVETAATVKLSSILSSLSYALDLTEGHPRGHASRSCLIGKRIGRTLGLSAADLSDLFYALLLKDAGCSSNSARVFHLAGGDGTPPSAGCGCATGASAGNAARGSGPTRWTRPNA